MDVLNHNTKKVKEILSTFKLYLLQFLNLFILFLARKRGVTQSKKILIVKPNGVGDYILLRNFFVPLKEKYSDHEIVLLGSVSFKDLAEKIDSDVVDSFIWINKPKIYNKIFQKFSLLRKMSGMGFNIVIHPRSSRMYMELEDLISAATGASIKYTCPGYLENCTTLHKKKYAKLYTNIIGDGKPTFEFLWYKDFFQQLIGKNLSILKPEISKNKIASNLELPKNKFAVLFPGAGNEFRQWDTKNFAEVGAFLHFEHNYEVVIAGSPSEIGLANEIIASKPNINFHVLSGKISLLDLVYIIQNADLCISNETAATHIAVAVNTTTVCISNGNHYKRFNPYPQEVFDRIETVYPPEIFNNRDNDELLQAYTYGSSLDINAIHPDTVINILRQQLSTKVNYL